jgi:GDP/UDP-N,N'-diacetylbacillosamine 2-epimerase (hydrolysing)
MKIAVLTSSRADYGIYLPLLKKLLLDDYFSLSIVAFGTHLSNFHGNTANQIINDGFDIKYKIESLLLTDSKESIATSMGLTTIKFASFWEQHGKEFDLVLCLGDRFEMLAAVMAAIPFNIIFAHLHGGETTLGAIDNIFRHSISLASTYHFVATPAYAQRVEAIINSKEKIHCVGALSLANLSDLKLLSITEFNQKWNIDLSKKTILVTFHPETINVTENDKHAIELVKLIKHHAKFNYLITMPNADTSGSEIRNIFQNELGKLENVYLVENLGTQSYFTAMKYCAFLLGNTSSGIIEAASFNKYVINLGDRQKGRATSKNIVQVPLVFSEMDKAIADIPDSYSGENIYYKENSADLIINILKQIPANAKS